MSDTRRALDALGVSTAVCGLDPFTLCVAGENFGARATVGAWHAASSLDWHGRTLGITTGFKQVFLLRNAECDSASRDAYSTFSTVVRPPPVNYSVFTDDCPFQMRLFAISTTVVPKLTALMNIERGEVLRRRLWSVGFGINLVALRMFISIDSA